MKNIFGIDNWKIEKSGLDNQRTIDVSIYLSYPSVNSLISLEPPLRTKVINKTQQNKLIKILDELKIDSYKLIGTKKRPSGISSKILYRDLKKISKVPEIEQIFIERVSGAKRINQKKPLKFFCVKMTIAIQIEGQLRGLQDYEEKFVLIKAKSSEEAIKRVEREEANAEPYFNPNAELVRWKLETIDDCYETFIDNIDEFNKPEGVEVYSILKKRRLSKKRYWDCKTQ
jgi:hypothetical protein